MNIRAMIGVLVALATPLLVSCGGARTAPGTTTQSNVGEATMTIKWPVRNTKVIPTAANAIVVTLTQGTKLVATSGPIARPANGGTSSWTTPALPQGTYAITAQAFPNANGTGAVQATGSSSIAITHSSVAQASVTMGSTVANVSFSPSTIIARPNTTLSLSAKATNASGDVVLVADSDLTWKVSDTSVLQLLTGGVNAQFKVLKAGTPTVSCTFSGVESTLGQQPVSAPTTTCTSSSPGPASSWPTLFGSEQGNPTTAAPSASGQVAWTLQLAGGFVVGIPPDGSILVEDAGVGSGAQENLTELNPDSSVKWTFSGSGLGLPVIASDGSVYVVDGQNLLVLNPNDGSVVASYSTPGQDVNCLLGSNGAIYWCDIFGGAAVNAINPDGSTWSVYTGQINTLSAPIIDPNNNVYVAVTPTIGGPGSLAAVSPNGTLLWNTALPQRIGQGDSILWAPNGTVYVSEFNGQISAVGSTGTILWQSQSSGSSFCADAQGNLYTSHGQGIARIDAVSGAATQLVESQNAGFGDVSLSKDNQLYCLITDPQDGSNALSAFDTSGDSLWTVQMNQGGIGGIAYPPPIAPDGSVYVVGSSSVLYKIAGSSSSSIRPGHKP